MNRSARDGRTADSAYRFFDEHGDLLALRSDMAVPIARLVASRYAGAEMPLRLCYLANAFRAVRPQRGQMREFAQAGVASTEIIAADKAKVRRCAFTFPLHDHAATAGSSSLPPPTRIVSRGSATNWQRRDISAPQ